MKLVTFAALACLIAAPGFASETFPGLKQVLSEAEWKRSGLDRLSPDQIGVIDAALIRHHGSTTAQHQSELASARAVTSAAVENTAGSRKPGLLERFGLPASNGSDWRDQPPLQATATEWLSANRFKLDNGQVWEGLEPITYDLEGKSISIHARPAGQFALTVDGKNTLLRVRRVR